MQPTATTAALIVLGFDAALILTVAAGMLAVWLRTRPPTGRHRRPRTVAVSAATLTDAGHPLLLPRVGSAPLAPAVAPDDWTVRLWLPPAEDPWGATVVLPRVLLFDLTLAA